MDSTDKYWAYIWSLVAGTLLALVLVLCYRSTEETKLYKDSTNPMEVACAKVADSIQMHPICVTFFQNK